MIKNYNTKPIYELVFHPKIPMILKWTAFNLPKFEQLFNKVIKRPDSPKTGKLLMSIETSRNLKVSRN